MENSSKELEVENKRNNCESCEDDDQRDANCFFGKGEQCTCQPYLEVKWNPCKDHKLIDKIDIDHSDADYCDVHTKTPKNLYCTKHSQFGCGECMCFDHKSCKIGYIHVLADGFKGSKYFKDIIEAVNRNITDAEKNINIAKKNEVELEQFEKNVEAFRNKVISHIDQLANDMLFEGRQKYSDNKKKSSLKQNECKQLLKDLRTLKQAIEAHMNNQNQLFVTTVDSKPKIEQIENRLNEINRSESIEKYEFFADPKLTALMDCKTFGTVQPVQSARDIRDMQTNAKTKYPRQVTTEKKVYLLHSEDKDTLTRFGPCIASGIKTVPVSSANECTEDFPVALLCRRDTDRAECDIESALVNLPEHMFKRTAIINIFSVSDKAYLPKVPTAEKVSKFKDIGSILDFAFVDKKKISNSNFIPWKHTQGQNSKEAFEEFVKDFYKPNTGVKRRK